MERQDEALRTARVWQPLVCLSLLAAFGLSAWGVEAAIHSEPLGRWMDSSWARVNDTPNEYKRQYIDTEDRVVLDDVAHLDPSSGGVYFFGASNMKWAMCVPDLPPDERRLVHNFGAGEGSPYFHRQFVDYLVEHKDLLQAGPEKTLIVYGAGFINAKPAEDSDKTVFSNMWRRYGLYRYDFRDGITPASHVQWLDAYLLEKARAASFVQALIDRGGRMAVPKSLRRRKTDKDPAVYAADYANRMGPDWEKNIRLHRRELQQWYDDVHGKGMAFKVVLLPLASWHKPLPYPPKYRAAIEEFCKTNRVELIDLSGLLSDDEFLDHIHPNDAGLKKTDAALMGIARDFLKKTGAWPQNEK